MLAMGIEDYFRKNGGDFEILYSDKPRGTMELARQAARSGAPVRIYACGGDGTLFDVVNGAFGWPNAEVGQIPCGAGNDFLKCFGPDTKAFLDIDAQVKGSSFPMDLIKCGDYYSINQCSMGFDAEIAAAKNHFIGLPFVSGKLAYVLAIFYKLAGKISYPLTIRINEDDPISGEYLFALAANAPYYGGGFKSAPGANPCDGRLEFVLIRKVGRLKLASLLKKYRRGEHGSLEIASFQSGKVMEVASPRPAAVNLDGEIIMCETARFEIAEKGIKFILPGFCTVQCDEGAEIMERGKKRAAPACEITPKS